MGEIGHPAETAQSRSVTAGAVRAGLRYDAGLPAGSPIHDLHFRGALGGPDSGYASVPNYGDHRCRRRFDAT